MNDGPTTEAAAEKVKENEQIRRIEENFGINEDYGWDINDREKYIPNGATTDNLPLPQAYLRQCKF